MKKNGTTTKGTTRWRCKNPHCNASTTNTHPDTASRRYFTLFITWISSTLSLEDFAATHHRHRVTLAKNFREFWLIQPAYWIDPHRIYEQIFIDGTYFGKGKNKYCLLTAYDGTHVICWHWCKKESTASYRTLLEKIPHPPEVVTLDGHHGALSAIKQLWPDAAIQRCVVHVHRNIITHLTRHPRTDAGKSLLALSRALLQITTTEQARQWVTQLQQFETTHSRWLKEKTHVDDLIDKRLKPKHVRRGATWWYTHYRQRRAWKLLVTLTRKNHLFTYLTHTDHTLAATTNCLEGGVNAHLKNLARTHRGQPPEHQRTIIDWWLVQHTSTPPDPMDIGRKQKWGKAQLAKAKALHHLETAKDKPTTDGRPALYDRGIESTPTNSMGIQKGWLGH